MAKLYVNKEFNTDKIVYHIDNDKKYLLIETDFIFIGFEKDERVNILPIDLLKKFPQSVIYSYYDEFGLNYNEKFILPDTTYDEFDIIIDVLKNPIKFTFVTDDIRKLMDQNGFMSANIFTHYQYLNDKKNLTISNAINQFNFQMNKFIDFYYGNSKFIFANSYEEYNQYSKVLNDKTKYIPVQIFGIHNVGTKQEDLIFGITILDGLPIMVNNYESEPSNNYYGISRDNDPATITNVKSHYIYNFFKLDDKITIKNTIQQMFDMEIYRKTYVYNKKCRIDKYTSYFNQIHYEKIDYNSDYGSEYSGDEYSCDLIDETYSKQNIHIYDDTDVFNVHVPKYISQTKEVPIDFSSYTDDLTNFVNKICNIANNAIYADNKFDKNLLFEDHIGSFIGFIYI